MKALLFALLVGCAPQGMTTSAQHPANPDAPTGRLAGPPAALRPGVADVSTPARETMPAPTTDHSSHGAAPQTPASDHSGHQEPSPTKTEPAKSKPAKTEPAKTAPVKTQPTPKKPAPTKPPEKPRKQDKPPASKTAPGTEPPKQTPPPAHQGHEGHH